jgi:hypothetical protein
MASKHLKNKPHKINDYAWWYEEPYGLFVVSEVYTKVPNSPIRQYQCTTSVRIPWRAVRAALARKDQKA